MNAPTSNPYETTRRVPADPIAAQLRRALRDSGRSIGHLARDAGIDRRGLARFLSGAQPTLTDSSLDALADALGLRVTLAPLPGRRRG